MILHRFHLVRDEGGQGLTEYAFILVLLALVSVGILSFVGQAVADQFCVLIVELSSSADLPSACSKPIARAGPVEQGPGYLNLEVNVYDPDGDPDNPYAEIAKVEFYIDDTSGTPVQTEYHYRYCLGSNTGINPCRNYDTDGLSPGPHTVIALVYDTDGNIGRMQFRFTI